MRSSLKRAQQCFAVTMLAVAFAGLGVLSVVGFSLATAQVAQADDDGGGDDGGGDGGGGGGGTSTSSSRGEGSASRGSSGSFGCSVLGRTLFPSCRKRRVKRPRQAQVNRKKAGVRREAKPIVRRTLKKPVVQARRSTKRPSIDLVLLGATEANLDQLEQLGFRIIERRPTRVLGPGLVRVGSPAGLTRQAAIRRARGAVPGAVVALNDLYRPTATDCDGDCSIYAALAWPAAAQTCSVDQKIGMIDTAVDRAHSALAGTSLFLETTRTAQLKPSDTDHGTAVASLLAGRKGEKPLGLAAAKALYAADAFHRSGKSDQATVFDLVAALDWLLSVDVRIVNMSLSGPDNDVLAKAVQDVLSRRIVVVAAVGNERSATGPGFPARYDGVIAVSGVDGRLRALGSGNRGQHVDFAAPGAGLTAATRASTTGIVRGSSFAAPIVTMAYAIGLGQGLAPDDLTKQLASAAKDLGPPGRDSTYGFGLIQLNSLSPCQG